MKATIHGIEVGANNNNFNNCVPRDVDVELKGCTTKVNMYHFESQRNLSYYFLLTSKVSHFFISTGGLRYDLRGKPL